MARFDLVIFDCDGVLVDSELIANRVFQTMLSELGLEVPMEYLFENFLGHSMTHCLSLVRDLLGREVPADFEPRLRERTAEAFEAELQPVAGIVATLSELSLPCCVASSGPHSKMRVSLGVTGLFERFDGRIFSAHDVGNRGKPAPDVFLFAAERMGVLPERAVVIEDSVAGVTAAVAAGMTVFAYAKHTPEARLRAAGAHEIFYDMREVGTLIA
jgi:HAD superfamily hydrolase (TIGR01509 family)